MSERKIEEWHLVSERDYCAFEEHVDRFLKEGWTFYGGICVTEEHVGDGYCNYYYQMMVKYE